MVRYCGNIKCTLWEPIYTTIDEKELPRSLDKRSSKTAIVGRCSCCGAAAGDCLRCGGLYRRDKMIFLMDDFDIR